MDPHVLTGGLFVILFGCFIAGRGLFAINHETTRWTEGIADWYEARPRYWGASSNEHPRCRNELGPTSRTWASDAAVSRGQLVPSVRSSRSIAATGAGAGEGLASHRHSSTTLADCGLLRRM